MTLLKSLHPLWHALQLAYARWALREIDPLHRDVPSLVLRVAELERSSGRIARAPGCACRCMKGAQPRQSIRSIPCSDS